MRSHLDPSTVQFDVIRPFRVCDLTTEITAHRTPAPTLQAGRLCQEQRPILQDAGRRKLWDRCCLAGLDPRRACR